MLQSVQQCRLNTIFSVIEHILTPVFIAIHKLLFPFLNVNVPMVLCVTVTEKKKYFPIESIIRLWHEDNQRILKRYKLNLVHLVMVVHLWFSLESYESFFISGTGQSARKTCEFCYCFILHIINVQMIGSFSLQLFRWIEC